METFDIFSQIYTTDTFKFLKYFPKIRIILIHFVLILLLFNLISNFDQPCYKAK